MLSVSLVNTHLRRILFLLLAAGLLPARRACAQAGPEDIPGPQQSMSLGGRVAYYRPNGAEHGDWAEGAQLRLHFPRIWALEGAADVRHNVFGGTKVDVVPVQLSLMAYLLPTGSRVAPYLLAGGGWYFTHVGAPLSHSVTSFGPHVGAGAEFFLSRSWSLDGSCRYLWPANINSQDQNFSDKGLMFTGALNYIF